MRRWLPLLLALFAASPPAFAQLPEGDVHGYVYVEAFELRKEFAVRLRSFPGWTAEVPLDGVLEKSHQARILFQVAKTLAESCPLEVDGTPLPLELDVIRFVRVEPEAGVVADEREQIPVQEAQVAAVFGSALRAYPNEISVHWNLFAPDPAPVLLSFVSGAGKSSVFPTRENPTQKWAVPKEKDAGVLLPVPQVQLAPPASVLQIPFFTLLFAGLAVVSGIAGRLFRGTLKILAGSAAVFFLVFSLASWAVAGFPVRATDPAHEPLTPQTADTLVHALIRNIYSSFDYREESRIYDTLEQSVHGSLLEKIYIDVRRGLELEENGGPRVKINHIDLRNCQVEPVGGNGGLRADAEWVAVGDVTHWGHIHTRLNKYHAWLTIEPIESTWKVVDIEIIEEARM